MRTINELNRLPVMAAMLLVTVSALGEEKPAEPEKATPVAKEEIRQAIGELGHTQFAKREGAQRELSGMAERDLEAVLNECLPAYAKADDVEVSVRLRAVLRDMFEKQVLNRPMAFLGIHMRATQTPGQNGAPVPAILVAGIVQNTAAAAAGLQAEDMILGIDSFDMNQGSLLQAFLGHVQSKQPGEKVTLTMKRGEQIQTVEVELKAMSEEFRASTMGGGMPVDERFRGWLQGILKRMREKKP